MKTIYEQESIDIQKLIFQSIKEDYVEEHELINFVLNKKDDISYLDVLSELQYLCNEDKIERDIVDSERTYNIV